MSDRPHATELPSWHDNLVYGLRFDAADPDRGLWRSDLVLDIDHIVEWLCGVDGRVKFLVAPATLVFHDVTDLRITVDFSGDAGSVNINEPSIHSVVRTPAAAGQGFGSGPYYRWAIELNLPQGSGITFGASGFTQTLRAAPQLCDEQRLPAADRPPLT